MKQLNDKSVISSGFIYHFLAFFIFMIACVVPNIVIALKNNKQFQYEKKQAIVSIFENLACFFSQVFLIIIFNQLT